MTSAQALPVPQTLTYEAYMNEGEIKRRYDIVDGIRVMAPAPVYLHQVISDNITELFRHFVREHRIARAVSSPIDILIDKRPLRTRQPDVLLMSEARYIENGGRAMRSPLVVAPELVVEILSPSDRQDVLAQKLNDYRRVDVRECWLVDIAGQNVERLRLTREMNVSEGAFGAADTISSLVFPRLEVLVSDIFAE